MGSNDTFCRDASLSGHEPLFGTAAEASVWLMVEHDGPWGVKGVDDSGVPEAVLSQLKAFERGVAGARVQLARRPDRAAARVWLARTTQGQERFETIALPALDALGSVDLLAWAEGRAPSGAEPVEEPMFFVCVHGRRDRCCAVQGMPVYSALDQQVGERAFMTTHLGGHRFAATLLVLPHGIAYGRIEADEAEALVRAHARGELHDLARIRGRTSYPAAVQAADVALRERLGERRVSALRPVVHQVTPEGERVVFADETGGEHALVVRKESLLPIVQSCGAEPKPGKRFVVAS